MEALKKATLAVAKIVNTVSKVMEDGKFQWGEALLFIPNFKDIIAIVSNSPDAYREIKAGITPTQRAEIENEVATKLKVSNEKAKALTQSAISWLIITVDLVSDFIAFSEKK